MGELNDKNLEQVAGGACYDFDVLWAECERKNCDGCASAGTCNNKKYLQMELMHNMNRAKSNHCAVVIPYCPRRK